MLSTGCTSRRNPPLPLRVVIHQPPSNGATLVIPPPLQSLLQTKGTESTGDYLSNAGTVNAMYAPSGKSCSNSSRSDLSSSAKKAHGRSHVR